MRNGCPSQNSYFSAVCPGSLFMLIDYFQEVVVGIRRKSTCKNHTFV
jgi:hypothetical protein